MSWFKVRRLGSKSNNENLRKDGAAELFRQFLPGHDKGAPAMATEEGKTVVAGKHALWIVGDEGIESSGLWHEVQYCSWQAQDRRFHVSWIDQNVPVVALRTKSENPKRFMSIVTNRVDKTIVLSRSKDNKAGGTITASVRRRADGQLFSLVFARGKSSPQDELLAAELERSVRGELGLGS